MKIFINAGHGGKDSGAIGNGLIERDVNLRIGNLVAKYLKAVDYDVTFIQHGGVKNDLEYICREANNWHADLFVSIHCNAFNGKASGTETIYYEYSTAGKELANCIQRQIVSSLGTVDRGLKAKIGGGYDAYVTKYTNMPAVLVECAFIDNPYDAKLLREREDDFARAIARGISDYVANLLPLSDVVDKTSKR